MSGMKPAIGGPTVPARLSSRSVTLACAILFALVILLFPAGTLPSRSARGILWAFAAGLAVVVQQALEPAHLSVWLSQRPDWETTQDRTQG